MLKIKKTHQAEDDLIGIWLYTFEKWGERQADRYLDDLDDTFQTLQQYPELARERVEFFPSIRIHPHRHHLIIYSIKCDHINIIRILHESMNIEEYLK